MLLALVDGPSLDDLRGEFVIGHKLFDVGIVDCFFISQEKDKKLRGSVLFDVLSDCLLPICHASCYLDSTWVVEYLYAVLLRDSLQVVYQAGDISIICFFVLSLDIHDSPVLKLDWSQDSSSKGEHSFLRDNESMIDVDNRRIESDSIKIVS